MTKDTRPRLENSTDPNGARSNASSLSKDPDPKALSNGMEARIQGPVRYFAMSCFNRDELSRSEKTEYWTVDPAFQPKSINHAFEVRAML